MSDPARAPDPSASSGGRYPEPVSTPRAEDIPLAADLLAAARAGDGEAFNETAALLDISVPAVNSAVQRARAALSGTRPAATVAARMRLDDRQRQVLDRFIDAWLRCDIDALAALLREDVILSMPPELTTIAGRAQVAAFFATVPADGRLDTIRLVRTRANSHPALAAYLPDRFGRCHGYGIMVFTITGDGIATITGFPSPGLFEKFGLAPTCD